ncbi:MAG TPA: alpha/beta fold hydrolase [Acidobacteriota bacterium]|nr:alpha/beta fold hydrolase [Acidobacteriota bacterium]HQM63121.1 alpha/beta fold hydrolase [Acidobacteriota bacterium]
MPHLSASPYRPPVWLRSGHLQTIYPTLCRRVGGVAYRRERIELPDGDFVDVDWHRAGAPRAALILHGLESSSRSHYVLGMVRALGRRSWDVAALNFRSCSGEPNRLLRSYHSGDTGDAAVILARMAATGYRDLALVGFSLGGNVTLKYLGESPADLPDRLRVAAAVSVPCDLAASAHRLARPTNRLYMRRFIRRLTGKIAAKAGRLPGQVQLADYAGITNFEEFDDRYTAPVHGFTSAADYWARASCLPFLPAIRVPTLVLNALDDPFLTPACHPITAAAANANLFLETPRWGGHVGFIQPGGEYYHETRVGEFFEQTLPAVMGNGC